MCVHGFAAGPVVVFAAVVVVLLAGEGVDNYGGEVGDEPVVVCVVEVEGYDGVVVVEEVPLVEVGVD